MHKINDHHGTDLELKKLIDVLENVFFSDTSTRNKIKYK